MIAKELTLNPSVLKVYTWSTDELALVPYPHSSMRITAEDVIKLAKYFNLEIKSAD